MVHLFAISITKQHPSDSNKAITLASHTIAPSSWLAYFYKNTIKEFTHFISKFVTTRTPEGMKQQIEKDQYVAYVHKLQHGHGLTCVVVTDHEYPPRVAFSLCDVVLQRVQSQFKQKHLLQSMFASSRTDHTLQKEFEPLLKDTLNEYQDPTKVDKILAAKKELDSAKVTMHVTIEKLLNVGEQLDTLIARSDDLSDSAKQFYIKSKSTNCCVIL